VTPGPEALQGIEAFAIPPCRLHVVEAGAPSGSASDRGNRVAWTKILQVPGLQVRMRLGVEDAIVTSLAGLASLECRALGGDARHRPEGCRARAADGAPRPTRTRPQPRFPASTAGPPSGRGPTPSSFPGRT